MSYQHLTALNNNFLEIVLRKHEKVPEMFRLLIHAKINYYEILEGVACGCDLDNSVIKPCYECIQYTIREIGEKL